MKEEKAINAESKEVKKNKKTRKIMPTQEKIAKERNVIPDPIDDRKFQE